MCDPQRGTTGLSCLHLLVFFTIQFLPLIVSADAPPATIAISIQPSDEPGQQVFLLQWPAASNTTYLVQAGSFGDTPGLAWQTIDTVTPTGNLGVFKVTPEKVEAGSEVIRRAKFYRVLLPQPAIFDIEPFNPPSGGQFYIVGQ